MLDVETLRQQLTAVLEDDEIVRDDEAFLLDQRRRYRSKNVVVVQPKSVAQVQKLVRFCYENRIGITPQGGNTGLVGGSTAQSGVVLNLSRLNRIRRISDADQAMTVEAGCILHDVQQAATEAGWFFPLSLASEGSCQIGGNIACNAGGLNVLRYGTMRDLVMGLEVVLPDGELISQLQPLHKNTTGYDLKHLFIGSEGTLGIITAATLKLFAPSRSSATAWVGVQSIHDAVRLLALVKRYFAERLTSFELIGDFALSLSVKFSKINAPLSAEWHVLLELNDTLPRDDLADLLGEYLLQHGFEYAVIAQSLQQQADFWTLRENISAAQKDLGVSIKHDIAVPIEQVADFVENCRKDLLDNFRNIHIVVFGHLGDGSLHYNVFLPDVSHDAYAQEDAVNRVVYQNVLSQQGTIAAEHGIGCLKPHWLHFVRSEKELTLMLQVRQQIDEYGLFNADKLLPK